ncbi:MAG: hypothetical protein AABX73_00560 [Nanoarchaeota archaeon]
MEKKTVLFGSIILVIVVIVFGLFIFNSEVKESPKQLASCNTFEYNGEGKINLVFFGDYDIIRKYSNSLFDVSPLKENKDEFNVFYILDYKPACEIYKDVALFCYSKDLIKNAAACPNDYLIVVDEKTAGIRSSSYMNVMSINSQHPLSVLSHEFGHAFAGLAEEYIPAKLPRRAKNCAASCSQFGEKDDGCFEGCSKEEYYRSIENGIMRSLSSSKFGVFNEFLIQELIENRKTSITGRAIIEGVNCNEEKYYLIEGSYDFSNNEIILFDKSIENGCLGGNGYGGFDYQINDKEGRLLSGGVFNPELIFTDAPSGEEITGETYESDKSFILKMPILEGAESLEILHNNKKTIVYLGDMGARPCKV